MTYFNQSDTIKLILIALIGRWATERTKLDKGLGLTVQYLLSTALAVVTVYFESKFLWN